MDITIMPGKLEGRVTAIPSKSQAHRLLICAAFADSPTTLICPDTNRDIEATAQCLNALGAEITRTEIGYRVIPVVHPPKQADLFCRDSGSTLRFLLPIAGTLGVDATFHLEGRLAQRPLSPLWEEMERMGCCLSRPAGNTVFCTGKLKAGEYTIDGGVSSQFITGLLLALPLLHSDSRITVQGRLESEPYVAMTQQAMAQFGVSSDQYKISASAAYRTPGELTVEGDWSNGAFFLAAHFLGNPVQTDNLSDASFQGDRAVAALLPLLREHAEICAVNIPDLVPILAVVAAAGKGAVFTGVRRLRLKESDRVASVIAMLRALGADAWADEDSLTVSGTGLTGGTVDSVNDHRIAMSAAIASTVCTEPVTVLGAGCVEKSYPQFWNEFSRLGGRYEQYLR